ncbi:hypothetical protein BDV93DRAFT_493259 [Ceratobasidium sp. AG-I]|nr:hypothetical protein BDV93DRAFT_493259 [Ceratobasidium sp. AG-I]
MSGSYTDHPTQLSGIVFPNQSMQALSSVIHLLGTSLLAFCFSRRTTGPLLSWETWASMTWPRLCVLLVFLDSWLFLFSTGILIGGAGMSSTSTNCALGIYACIVLYALSKVLIYLFLAEKVHVVWGGTHQPRMRSKVYWLCMVTMTPYVAIVIIMLIGRVAYFRADRACIIGLRKYASLSLLIYDLYINIFLTGMFLWPLFRSRLSNPRIRKVALRTLVAAAAALTTSTINIAVLTIMHGQQLGWVCLGSCGTDVTVNALVLFWVTDNVGQSADNTPATNGVAGGAPGHGGTQVVAVSNQSLAMDEGMVKSPTRFVLPGHVGAQPQYSDSLYDYIPHHGDRVTAAMRSPAAMSNVVLSKGQQRARSNSRGRKHGSFLGRIGEAFKSKSDDDRQHQMSVQVTITTELQEDIMMSDVKYGQGAESIADSATNDRSIVDVEKGGQEEAEDKRVTLPPRRD